MRKEILFLFCAALLLLPAACNDSKTPPPPVQNAPEVVAESYEMVPLHMEGGLLRDPAGRIFILHGVNYSQERKRPPFFDWQDVKHFEDLASWGFNVIRYLINWDSIEPERGYYDVAAIDEIEEGVQFALENNIYVLLDMHQDIYSPLFNGNGMPEWTALDDPNVPNSVNSGDWYMNYANMDVCHSFDNFYTDEELQLGYANAWIKVIERIKKYPNVIGYDLINEPWIGTCAPWDFEETRLLPFYNKLTERIRTVDPDRPIFLEPSPFNVNQGLPSLMPLPDDPNVVFTPHYYDPLMVLEKPYDNGKWRVEEGLAFSADKAIEWGTGAFLGEFGANLNQEGSHDYLQDIVDVAEALHFSGWTYWNYYPLPFGGWHNHNIVDKNGDPHPILDRIVRPRPAGLLGTLVSQKYDVATGTYLLEWTGGVGINQILVPTWIYPAGIQVEIEDATWTYDPESQILQIDVLRENGAAHRLKITP
ncbi:MAG: cellulase family glycosylhydrolase [Planctomycetota bacterium]|nr:cellulase family glycosylhydrolase [Planctomycetota bacterium]